MDDGIKFLKDCTSIMVLIGKGYICITTVKTITLVLWVIKLTPVRICLLKFATMKEE